MYKQQIKVTSTDPIRFLEQVQDVIIRGARKKDKTYVKLTIPFVAEFEVDVTLDSIWKDNGPSIYATPCPKEAFVYTKEQVEGFDWETFKKVVAFHDIKGRDRTVMTTQYLKATEQLV